MDNQRNACFIIPYFGKLPATFPIYLRTCAANPDFDWLIVTDDQTPYPYPENVHVSYMTFGDFVERVQSCFDFPISLVRPYKICDFRAAFGVIFAQELKNYRFWGHCDLDQYFGTISHFISDEILSTYDKILCLGHFTLFRNCPEINKMYLIPDRTWNQSYKDAFSQEKHWIFDEWPADNTCINRIMKQEKVNTYYCHDAFCDLVPFVSRFRRYIFDHNAENWTLEPIKNTVFAWENGILYQCFRTGDGSIAKKEALYVHIRQRKLDLSRYEDTLAAIYVYPNRISSAEHLHDGELRKLLRKTALRNLLKPDELARRKVLWTGLFQAALRRLKRIFKHEKR